MLLCKVQTQKWWWSDRRRHRAHSISNWSRNATPYLSVFCWRVL